MSSLLEIIDKLNSVLNKPYGSLIIETVFYLFLVLNILHGSWLIYIHIFCEFDNNSVNFKIFGMRTWL